MHRVRSNSSCHTHALSLQVLKTTLEISSCHAFSSLIHQGSLLLCAGPGRAYRAQQAPSRASSSGLEHCSPPVPNHKYLSSYKRGQRDTAAQKTDKPFVVWGFLNPQKNNSAPSLCKHIKPTHQTKHECKANYRWRWHFGPTSPPPCTIYVFSSTFV